MKSDSKLYRFFLGKRGTIGVPTVAILIVLVPFLVFGFFFKNNKRENLANNPVSTRVVIEEISSVGQTRHIHYHLQIKGISYDGSGRFLKGLAVGDTIGVMYQKDNPANNMTVYDYYDHGDDKWLIVIILLAAVLGIYRWSKTGKTNNTIEIPQDRNAKCQIYRTPKHYIFLTVYYSVASKPIYFLSHDCTDSEFEKTMFDCLETSVKGRYEDMKASELIKAMKQQSWRQLYLNSTMCLVEYSSKEYLGDKLSIEVGKRRKDGRGFDWDSSRSRSFDMEETDWRQTIGIIRSILEPTINEIDR